MQELVNKIKGQISAFETESEKFLKGNKAAGTRARKATLELEKLFKQFRKESINGSKED